MTTLARVCHRCSKIHKFDIDETLLSSAGLREIYKLCDELMCRMVRYCKCQGEDSVACYCFSPACPYEVCAACNITKENCECNEKELDQYDLGENIGISKERIDEIRNGSSVKINIPPLPTFGV